MAVLPPLWGYNTAPNTPPPPWYQWRPHGELGLIPTHGSNLVCLSPSLLGWCQKNLSIESGLISMPSGKEGTPTTSVKRTQGPGTATSQWWAYHPQMTLEAKLGENLHFFPYLVITRWHPSALPQWYQRKRSKTGSKWYLESHKLLCKCPGFKYKSLLIPRTGKISNWIKRQPMSDVE